MPPLERKEPSHTNTHTHHHSLHFLHPKHTHTHTHTHHNPRSRFLTGASPILLLTERFYFYRRIRIRGARRVLFYGPPTVSHFYSEICNAVVSYAATPAAAATFSSSAPATVTTLFTRWDRLSLERVVGSTRVEKMCDESNTRSSFSFL